MKKYTNHRLGWKGGILIALISTILLYTLATVYAEEEADVSVEWQPEVSEAKTGETVAIRLSSYINTETAESVEVKIALTEEEASMLGELPEGLALENAEGGGMNLTFRLTQEQPSLEVELTASVPAKTSASASIEVTEDDIQIEAVGKAVDSSEAEGRTGSHRAAGDGGRAGGHGAAGGGGRTGGNRAAGDGRRAGSHRATGADTGEKGWNAAFYGVFWLDA